MTVPFGKALSGGRPVNVDKARELKVEHLQALREHYRARAPLKPSNNVLDKRVAEEMEMAARQLELVEAELKRRGNPVLADQLDRVEHRLADLARIVGADDKCEGVARAEADLKRRLNRRTPDGRTSFCEKR